MYTSSTNYLEIEFNFDCFVFVALSPKKKKRFSKSDRVSNIAWDLEPQGPSLAEDEELALQLLSGP